MKTGGRGLDIIRSFEGGPGGDFASEPYLCPAGYPTIGWGHRILRTEHFDPPITREAADRLLAADLAKAEQAVEDLVQVPLTQGQFDALVSFVFNLGASRLKQSTLLRKLNGGDYLGAANEFPRWKYAGGMPMAGLLRRREEERSLFLSEHYQPRPDTADRRPEAFGPDTIPSDLEMP